MIETERLRLEPLSREHLEPWTRFMLGGDARAKVDGVEVSQNDAHGRSMS